MVSPLDHRPARATRGKRLSRLVDEEAEADEEFWGQDAFKEDEADNEYEAEQEVADEFDSDFNDDEDESDDGEVEEKERRPTKKRKLPPGKKSLKKGPLGSAKKKGVSFLEEAAAAADAGEALLLPSKPVRPLVLQPSPEEKEDGDNANDLEGEKSLRKSTRTAVIVKQAEREAQRAIQQALPKIVKKKKGEDERKMTQEEMLLEAAQTEIQNRQSLEIMLAREEEVKRKAIINKEVYSGALIRFYSRDGKNILEFTKMADVPEVIRSKAPPYPKQPICVVTGLPAKYRDPRSGLPYATKEAFAVIRERLRKGENPYRKEAHERLHQRKRTKVEREKPEAGGRVGVMKIRFKKTVLLNPEGDKNVDSSRPQFQRIEVTVRSSDGAGPSATGGSPALERVGRQNDSTAKVGAEKESKQNPVRTPPPIPRAMLEANEADFMLDDLEVSLPSNLETGLSIQTSGTLGQSGEMIGQDGQQGLHLEHEMLDLSPTGRGLQRFSEGYDLSIDGTSNSLLSLDVSWLHNA